MPNLFEAKYAQVDSAQAAAQKAKYDAADAKKKKEYVFSKLTATMEGQDEAS